MSKICPNCSIEFSTKDKRKKFCGRSCSTSFNNRGLNRWSKVENLKTKEEKLAYQKKYIQNVIKIAQKYVYDYLLEHPCVDCGENDPIVLQFDHRDPLEKNNEVSAMLNRSVKLIQLEIDKCDVRCANCHIKRTAKQFNYYRLRLSNLCD